MSATAVLAPAEYESQLRRYVYDRSEEARAVRVGEKETSEQAEIVARYAELFSGDQLAALRGAEEREDADEREHLYRLRKTCEGGIIAAELADRQDALENAILAARLEFGGESMPLRAAQARLAVLEGYADREELGRIHADASAEFNDDRLELLRAYDELEAELTGERDPVARTEEEKGISLVELEAALAVASTAASERFADLRERWFGELLGPERDDVPSSYHVAFVRRLSPLEAVYTKERAVEVCMDTLASLGFRLDEQPNIRLDLEDRPQKSPRACVIASDPPEVVHLITRAMGGLHDYQAFLHEAGHALHYAGCDPDLPYAFRRLARDHALTEIYSFAVESISREPAWHAQLLRGRGGAERRGGGVPRGAALPPVRREAPLRARLLVAVPGRPRHSERLRGAAHRGHRSPLPGSGLPGRHGRGLLLRGLPARVDPLRPAARAPPGRGGRRLVAEPPHGRASPRPLPGGHASRERGDRGASRVRSARHPAPARRARRVAGAIARRRPVAALLQLAD